MKKIMLGLLLALTVQSQAQSKLPYKQRAKASQEVIVNDYDDERDYSAEEEKLIEQIKAAKEKLKNYKISQSTLELMGDLFISTALGGAMGAVGGAVQGSSLNHDRADLIAFSAIQAFSGAINGFWLGVGADAGLYPKMSLGKLTLILAVHNALVAALSTLFSTLSEAEKFTNTYSQFGSGSNNAPMVITEHFGRRPLSADEAATISGGRTIFINILSLLAIIPEFIAIRYSRAAVDKNKTQNEELLVKLEKALRRAEFKALREELQA